ncbi:MAG: hypothetical protein PSN44_02410 [Gammaproteobacteria bacterium]|nr:hypothetical protein [Gammaproteobacteria bacterium]
MKIEDGKLIFEKLVESNPERPEGALNVAQIITVPQPAQATIQHNASGQFSDDVDELLSSMRSLSKCAASLAVLEG